MSRTMIQAAVTMNQLQHKLDLVGYNLANSQTTGYKSRQSEFSSLLYQQINNLADETDTGGRMTPEGLRVGSGAVLGAIQMDLRAGSQTQTDRTLDVALTEDHHLLQIQVSDEEGTRTEYTRDGSLYLSPMEGNDNDLILTTKDGFPLLGTDGPMIVSGGFDQINIEENGQVNTQSGDQLETVGQLSVVEVLRPELLEASGQNLFRVPDVDFLNLDLAEVIQPVQPAENILRSGTLENSNVDLQKQLTDILMTQRSYQLNARTITMSDQMLGLINQLRS